MRYKCQNCGDLFFPRDAGCEDWREKKLSFICPNCRVYLKKPENIIQEKGWKGAAPTLIKYGLAAFGLQLLAIYLGANHPMVAAIIGGIALIALLFYGWMAPEEVRLVEALVPQPNKKLQSDR
ncbi:hypothetical protein [Alcanivorax sp.]|uniref:hypothetical protein n=1 Tax=Alcanivorax sp. TaxID=1872427 RepID=UPI003DA7154E